MNAKAKAGLLIGVALAGAVPSAVILVNGWNSLWVKQDLQPAAKPATNSAPAPNPAPAPGTAAADPATAIPSNADRLAASFDAVDRPAEPTAAVSTHTVPAGTPRYAELALAPPSGANVTMVTTHPSKPRTADATPTEPTPAKVQARPLLPPVPPSTARLGPVDPALALATVDTPVDPAGRAIRPDTPAAEAPANAETPDASPAPTLASLPAPPPPRVLPVDVPAAYRKLIEEEASADKVPVNLALAVVATESSFKADKRGDDGKLGLFQIRYSIAKALGYKGSTGELLDPATNVKWGMKYLAGAYSKAGGDTCKTAMKFLGGHYQEDFKPAHAAYCQKLEDRMAALD